jgi:hypothetical protein
MKPAIHHLRNMFVLVPALFACSAVIHQLTPAPFVRSLTPKLTHLEESPDAYDILFVGSSRVFRQISPKIFDQELRAHDFNLRSFNAGVPAAKSVEVWHLLRGFAADKKIRAKYVLIEPDGLLIGIARENLATEREIYWHGCAETTLAIESLGRLKTVPRLTMTGLHAGAFLLDRLGVGRLRLLVSQFGESKRLRWLDKEGLGPDGDGWVPYDKADTSTEFPRRQEFLDDLPRYRSMLARQAGLRSQQDCLTEYHRLMLANLMTAIEALGAQPVFILSPATEPRCEVHQAFRDAVLPNLIAFDDFSTYPELYAVEHRHDLEHLNTEGSVLYSRLLADRFAKLMLQEAGGGNG